MNQPHRPLRSTERRFVVVGLAVAAAVLLAGCSRDVDAVAIPTVATSAASAPTVAVPTPDPVPMSSAKGSASVPVTRASPDTAVAVVDAEAFGNAYSDSASFSTPSGNIGCMMDEGLVLCDVLGNTWSLPPTPADCEFDFGIRVALVGTGPGELACSSDSVTSGSSAVLGYGESVELGGMACVSRETGLRCHNTSTQHGFTVSRASYTLF